MSKPWIEKYRPRTIDEIIIDEHTRNKLNKIIGDGYMPNLIITGVPGIGKTTTILCIARHILGEHYSEGVLELNASDDRGIKVAQGPVTHFCKKKWGYSGHKIILLDEADHLTKKSQQHISNLMEEYGDSTSFAFTCNTSTKIIMSIQSRAVILRYQRLNSREVYRRLAHICELENVPFDESGLRDLVMLCQGDLRQGINQLEAVYNGFQEITTESVNRLCDQPDPVLVRDIIQSCQDDQYEEACDKVLTLKRLGYPGSDIILAMFQVLKNSDIPEVDKIEYLKHISQTSLVISCGVDTNLQLTACLARMCNPAVVQT